MLGRTIGRFVVEELIGAGGMGEVYAARDTVLDRRVALKIVPESLATNHDRVERFMREARAASSLNHPAIVTVYDSGVADGIPYLAMELIDGETLTQWTRGGRNAERIAGVMTQVAEGLARAHASGIVHRDLKSDNIMVARGGYAKILDFGIAKLTERQNGNAAANTAPAAMLGTAAFMSPEQVERRAVDHRSDIFSFGCVLYAAFQGRSPFERDSPVKTMTAVVNDDPFLLPEAPLHVQRIARRCLNKDADERYQSIKDVALDLREGLPEVRIGPGKPQRAWLILAIIAAVLLGTGMWIRGRRVVEPPQMSMQRITNSGKTVTGAISPDGRYVVHATLDGDTESVWVRQIATGTDVRIIPPADGFYADMKVSPDGNYVFYEYAPRADANIVDIYQVPILGGESRKIVDNVDGLFTLSPDGRRIAFRRFNAIDREQRLLVKDLETSNETEVLKTRFPEFVGSAPAWSPDGRHLTIVTGSEEDIKKQPTISQLDIATGSIERVPTPPWPFVGTIAWLPDGSGMVICAADRQQPPQLWFVPEKGSPAKKITSDLAMYGEVSVTSDSQTMAAHRAENSVNLWLVPLDHPEKARALTTGLGNYLGTGGVRWLSDREFVYTVFTGDGTSSLKVSNIGSGASRQISHGAICWNLTVSPDRSRIAYASDRSGKIEVWLSDVNGDHPQQLTHGAAGGSSLSFFPDNRSVAYVSYGKVQAAWRASLDKSVPIRLTDRPANSPQVSPDGKLLLCRLRSVEPDVPLWRTAIVPIDPKGPPRYYTIPRSGGPHAFQWMSDGRAFAFIDSVNGAFNVWLQDVDGGPPRQLTRFDAGRISAYDISPDGKSILVARGDPVNDMVLIRGFR
jgi:Tol biopolymer transport system component/tRNA A-37 threonylcarbamoyl transferase component Bud32